MSELESLTTLDGRELARVIVQGDGSPGGLDNGELLAVVELLTFRLTQDARYFSADDWRSASRALEQILAAAEAVGSLKHEESVIRRLNLSSALLQRVSPQSDVPILSLEYMLLLFEEALPFSLEQARELASDWRSLEVEVVRQLRLAKNLVTPMLIVSDLIADTGSVAELRAWGAVLPMLP